VEYQFNAQEQVFRDEVEQFLETELPLDWPEKSMHWPGGYGTMEMSDVDLREIGRQFKRRLAEKGWLTIAWPREYGGREHSYMEQAIFDERTSYYRAPGSGIATGIAGPTILRFGTEKNKRDWIPRIAGGEIEMWLGYSEPNAGSDLSGIQTTAQQNGDEYVINGQKIWSTIAHISDYAWLIARTDPEGHRHRSISLFVVDNNAPGIEMRPLINIAGEHSFNEVFFDDVRVPKDNMICIFTTVRPRPVKSPSGTAITTWKKSPGTWDCRYPGPKGVSKIPSCGGTGCSLEGSIYAITDECLK